MGDQEETQEQMKADMSALKEQMASMMEAMLGMKRLMESNVTTTVATSTAVEADPILPTAVHHPIPNIMGRGRNTLGHANNPHLGYNQGAYPYGLPPNYTPLTTHEDEGHIIPLILDGQPLRHPDSAHEDPRERTHGEVDSYPPFPTEGPAPNALPQPNIAGVRQPRPMQPILLSVGGPPWGRKERRNLISSKRD